MKKVITFLCIGLLSILFASLVHADIITYSDDYLVFDYDNSVLAEIELLTDDSLTYSIYTQMLVDDEEVQSIFIEFDKQKDGWNEESFYSIDSYDRAISVDVLSKESPEICVHREASDQYVKLLGCKRNAVATISFYTNKSGTDRYKFCKGIYDSAHVTDYFLENALPVEMEFSLDTIYSNVLYSDLIEPYLQQAINICDAFLNFKIESYKAKNRSEALKEELTEVAKNSPYIYDGYAHYSFPLSIDFELEDDGDIIKAKQKMQAIIDRIEELKAE